MGTRPPSIATTVSVSVSMFAPFRFPGRCRCRHDSTIVRAIQLDSVLGRHRRSGQPERLVGAIGREYAIAWSTSMSTSSALK